MKFDRFTVALLVLRSDRPKLGQKEEDELQDAHMAHLAKLHDQGDLLLSGPLLGAEDRDIRGLSIYKGSVEEVKALADKDPGVRAGRYSVRIFPWMVPGGTVTFSRSRFPRSMGEV